MEIEKENLKPKQAWYTRTGVIVMILLSVGPLGLIFVWINPRWNIYVKIAVTVTVCLLTWWMWHAMGQYYQQLKQTVASLGYSI